MNNRIKEFRERKGLTQAALAEQVHITVRLLQNYEYRTVKPNVYTALALANALGCTVEELFEPKEEDHE